MQSQVNQNSNSFIESSSTTPTDITSSSTILTDCGNDINCFVNLANNCEPSKYVIDYKNLPTSIIDVGNIDITNQYRIVRKQGINCVAQMKNLVYKFTYNSKTVNLLLNSGKTQGDILNLENEMNQAASGTVSVCTLSLEKKMGDAIKQNVEDIANGNTNENCSTDLNTSVCTYVSGMVCSSLNPTQYNSSSNQDNVSSSIQTPIQQPSTPVTQTSVKNSTTPTITSLFVSSQPNNPITIYGTNFSGNPGQNLSVNLFSSDNNNVGIYATNIKLIDSKTISFIPDIRLKSGTYRLSVSGVIGQSNEMIFDYTAQ